MSFRLLLVPIKVENRRLVIIACYAPLNGVNERTRNESGGKKLCNILNESDPGGKTYICFAR